MKRMMIFGAALFAAALMGTSSASAQDCECVNGVKCYRLSDGTLHCDPNITCDGSFRLQPPIPTDPKVPVSSSGTATAITATLTSTQLGRVNISLDNSRTSPPTRLQSNSATSRFPLTAEINFYATATIESLPGVVVRSNVPLTYKTSTAQSVNPFVNERLALQNRVEFINPTNGQVVFSLEPGSSTITLGPNRD